MSINNNLAFIRELDLDSFESSCFLLGPRMTGKTTLLSALKQVTRFDLLEAKTEFAYKANPGRFWEELYALPRASLIAIDEIQRVPELLNSVQKAIEERGQRFILSGSSARKLKRDGANLLGGRALQIHLFGLSTKELGADFNIDFALRYGTLPKIWNLIAKKNFRECNRILRAYVDVYLSQEIKAEALVRNLGTFQRFLNVAAQANAQMIEYQNISRECAVPASTVKEYYQILEDTLIGRFLWPWDHNERTKARPRFYFFDTGVVRAIQSQLTAEPTTDQLGFLFETWFVNELIKVIQYSEKEIQIGLWRHGKFEVDILLSNSSGPIIGFECKTGESIKNKESLAAFQKYFPTTPLVVVNPRTDRKRKGADNIEYWPILEAVQFVRDYK